MVGPEAPWYAPFSGSFSTNSDMGSMRAGGLAEQWLGERWDRGSDGSEGRSRISNALFYVENNSPGIDWSSIALGEELLFIRPAKQFG